MSRGSKAPRRRLRLVPRLKEQGYDAESVAKRRRWLEQETDSRLEQVGRTELDPQRFRGNIENPIGTAEMPLGVAGPLWVRGEHVDGEVFVPLATTEGALVRSYERGMVAITRGGGAQARVWLDRNRIAPVFELRDVAAARDFALAIQAKEGELRSAADATTRHGRLESIACLPVGRRVLLELSFSTGDAHGMNMLSKAAGAVCGALLEDLGEKERESLVGHHVMSGYSAEKRAAGSLLRGGKGKKVTAGCRLDERTCRAVLHATPGEIEGLWRSTALAHLATGALGYNGHAANGLTALFIATGQDVANVANSAVVLTNLEVVDGDLVASVTLPSLVVATVGGGTALGTSRECLATMGCFGDGKARRLAEITAATVLAGELSMGAALASGEFVAAHEAYGRNRPAAQEGQEDIATSPPPEPA